MLKKSSSKPHRYTNVIIWNDIHSRSDTNRSGAEGLSFYYPRILYCPDLTLLEHHLQFVQRRRTCNSIKERDLICASTNRIPNTNPIAIELNPNCLGQGHSNMPGTIPGYEITKPRCISQYPAFHL